ncbi:sugar phosphate isomerase/epimerase family protein [Aestuariivirga sp.]|uniref:sugar phosphate isomerase/epimerase family protein n=1 Tax=Aestuariivirga sp. TaxID=2650926 RepID=UPI0039E6BDB8
MVRDLARHPEICSINTATLGFQAPIDEVIEAVARAGFGMISPWRRDTKDLDVSAVARQIRDAGLKLSGYCRSPYIPAATVAQYRANIAANKQAIDDAAVLGAPVFVMVVGSLPEGSKDIEDARRQVREACGELMEHGRKAGVKIGLEPLHPVYAADRSCLTLLSEALDWCEMIEGKTDEPQVGTIIDCYHVWWDPNIRRDIARAGREKRIFGFHVCDWLVPTTDVLNDRGMMGDGIIDIRGLRTALEEAGHTGAVEVEIFSAQNWWRRPMAETLQACRERFSTAT